MKKYEIQRWHGNHQLGYWSNPAWGSNDLEQAKATLHDAAKRHRVRLVEVLLEEGNQEAEASAVEEVHRSDQGEKP